jgi:hypothetical protein
MRPRAVAALLVIVGLLAAVPAGAKSNRTFTQPFDKVWPSLLRFLRVDEKLKIVEKDVEAGYVLFELSEEKRTFSGAVELVKGEDDRGRPTTRVTIKITDRPAYMEEGLLDRLEQKLHDEHGEPKDSSAGRE